MHGTFDKSSSRRVIGARPAPGVLALWIAVSCGGDGTDIIATPPPPPPPPPGSQSYGIEYATYLGGNGEDQAREPILLSGGRLLFGLRVESTDMPTTPGAFQRSSSGGADSYLAILSADGSRFEAATYFGGSSTESTPYGIGIASNGDIVFTSGTTSPDIPTSGGAYRPSLHTPVPSPGGDGCVCRISGDLTVMRWCTYTGGGYPRGGLVVDGQDNVIVVGRVTGSNFTTTSGAAQTEARGFDDAFVLKLDPTGTAAVFSTRLGGGGSTVGEVAFSARLTPTGMISVAGTSRSVDFPTTIGSAQRSSNGPPDAFMSLLDPSGSAFEYVTLLGGSSNELGEHRHWVLPDGTVLAAGVTTSADFPATSGSRRGQSDGYLARLRPDGSAFDAVLLLGGSGRDLLFGPVIDDQGRIYVFGETSSKDIQTTSNAVQRGHGGGETDGILFIFGPDGSTLEMVTYLGWGGDDLIRGIAVGPSGELYMVGRTDSSNLPVTVDAFQRIRAAATDGFVVKLVRADG